MAKTFKQSVVATIAVLVLLGGVAALAEFGPRPRTGAGRTVMKAVRTLDERELNREGREAQTQGYYEGLMDAAKDDDAASGLRRLLGRQPKPKQVARGREHHVFRKDFLYYELPANARVEDPRDVHFNLETNSHGMADKEYTRDKPSGTHRIALIGDSISYGYGTRPGYSYQAVLEQKLNAGLEPGAISQVEILNFSVGGYRATQLLEVGLEKAPPFKPDTYVVVITPLSLIKEWAHHVLSLLQNGIDLKYPYLRQVVADAGIKPDDPPAMAHAKLARHKWSTLRWVLSELKAQAARDQAAMVVALIPSVHPADLIDEQFDGVHDFVGQLDIPILDLLDAYKGAELAKARVAPGDNHPNEEGHRLIAEFILHRLASDPAMRRAMLGSTAVRIEARK